MPVDGAYGYGIATIGSEAYTSFANFGGSSSDSKPFGDAAYCAGINQMILHSNVHQPFDQNPGFTLGPFGSHYNRHTLWWHHASAWTKYQERIQYVMQKGTIAADALFYLGDQLPHDRNIENLDNLPYGCASNACNYAKVIIEGMGMNEE